MGVTVRGVGKRLGGGVSGGGGVVILTPPLRYSEALSNRFRKKHPSLWNPLMTSRRVC